ncbi:MAG: SWIM zinc finger family protein [Tannerella sp.]|jgi:hypothetical protein|nr:SWIM zinc finger family protein [Tannerella sp.]
MSTLKEQLGIIDEAYLTGMANKGLVNRALKDLEASGIRFTLGDNELKADFADGTSVSITGALDNFTCSCPSRTICKHVVMAMMKASHQEQLASVSEAPKDKQDDGQTFTPSLFGGFDYLLGYTKDLLIKQFGKSVYNDVLFKVLSGEKCEIEEGTILNLKLMDGAFTVRFLPGVSNSDSVCTCKAKNCRHLLEAILQYIKHKTGKLDFEPVGSDVEVDTGIIPHVMEFLESIFRIGLIRLPAEYSGKCAQFAVLCHGAGFADFERLFEVCSKELTLYGQKSAGFNRNSLMSVLTRIYLVCREIKDGGIEAALASAGKFKRQYLELPKLLLKGMGAYPWYAKSGFCGVTAIFYAPELRQTFTFTSSRPVESEKNAVFMIGQTWRAKTAWNLPISFNAMSKTELTLTGAKISDNLRLSSSAETVATLVGTITSFGFGVALEDFSHIKQLFQEDADNSRLIYTALQISALGEGVYNKITQTYTIQLTDKADNKLPLTIRYSKINETAILNFEFMEQHTIVPEAISVSISLPDEDFHATIFPIAVMINNEMINVGEYKMFTVNEKSNFAKFF